MSEVINTIVCPIVRQDMVLPMLKSLKKNTPANYRTIVVNQTVANRGFEEELYDSCDIVIRPHFNMGFAQAANWGMRLSPTKYVTVANDDILFLDNWWQGCMETFERFETAAAVCPMTPKEPGWGWAEPGYRYLVPERYVDPVAKALREEDRRRMEKVRVAKAKWEKDKSDKNKEDWDTAKRGYYLIQAELEGLIRELCKDVAFIRALVVEKKWMVVDGFACFCPVFRADRLAEVGMFDENFMCGGGEDYDALARYAQAGYRMLSTSRSFVWHHWGASKDSPDGKDKALPQARPNWNKLGSLWTPRCCVWGRDCERTTEEIYQAPL